MFADAMMALFCIVCDETRTAEAAIVKNNPVIAINASAKPTIIFLFV